MKPHVKPMGFFNYTSHSATAHFEGHKITVENAWKLLPPKTFAALSVDDVEVARSTDFALPTPHVAQLVAKDISDSIKTVDVFFAGVSSIKISIVVNGEVIQKDELSAADEMHVRYSQKS